MANVCTPQQPTREISERFLWKLPIVSKPFLDLLEVSASETSNLYRTMFNQITNI